MFALIALGTYSVITWKAASEAKFPIDLKDGPVVHGTFAVGEDVFNYHVLSDYMAERHPFSQLFDVPRVSLDDAIEAVIPDLAISRQLSLPLGVTCILAPTGWGKTVLVEEFITPALVDSMLNPTTINYVEPHSATADASTIYLNSPALLLARVGAAIMLGETLVVDSLRAFVYGKGRGGTGSKGVDQLLYPQLTAISNAAIHGGTRLVFTLNPMVTLDDAERYEEFANSITSSVSGSLVGAHDRAGSFYDRGPTTRSRDEAKIAIRVPDHTRIRDAKKQKAADPHREEAGPLIVGDSPSSLARNLVTRSLSSMSQENK